MILHCHDIQWCFFWLHYHTIYAAQFYIGVCSKRAVFFTLIRRGMSYMWIWNDLLRCWITDNTQQACLLLKNKWWQDTQIGPCIHLYLTAICYEEIRQLNAVIDQLGLSIQMSHIITWNKTYLKMIDSANIRQVYI